MVERFEKSQRTRGQSTLLYEDPDAVDAKDHDMVQALTKKLQIDDEYLLPDGFTRVWERVPEYKYDVSTAVMAVIWEPQRISLKILDDLVNKLFDVHFLEPKVEYVERVKARKLVKKLQNPVINPVTALPKVKLVGR